MKKSTQNSSPTDLPKRRSFPLTISLRLFDLLGLEVLRIKSRENYSFTRQQWITQAIRGKIQKEKLRHKKNKIATHRQSTQKRLSLLLEDRLIKEIDASLKERREQGDVSFSKKSWIIEAILEKLGDINTI